MALEIERYTYTPVYVKAVQVNAENMKAVAKWCGGVIQTQDNRKFIKVDVIRPMRLRQTQAFDTDWVIKTDAGFKVYNAKAFKEVFKPAPLEPAEELLTEIFTG